MEKLIYIRPGGDSGAWTDRIVMKSRITYGDDYNKYGYPELDYIISEIRGLGTVDVNINAIETPGQDGAYFQNVTLGTRVVTATLQIRAKTEEEYFKKRQRLLQVLNPSHGEGTLYYENKYGKYYIKAIPKVYGSHNQRTISCLGTTTIEFYCKNPYWYDDKWLYVQNIYTYKNGDRFPVTFPVKLQNTEFCPAVSSQDTLAQAADVNITISGECRGIHLRNLSKNEHMSLSLGLRKKEKLIINSQERTITKIFFDGTSIPVFPDTGYTFFTLPSRDFGAQIEAAFDWAGDGANVILDWKNKYAGV